MIVHSKIKLTKLFKNILIRQPSICCKKGRYLFFICF